MNILLELIEKSFSDKYLLITERFFQIYNQLLLLIDTNYYYKYLSI